MIPDNDEHAVRGRQILDWLRPGRAVGAEVGVYTGDLSAYLLSGRPDLTLWMVDSWGTHDSETPYRKTGDPHSALPQEMQDGFMQRARDQVAPFGDRARILHMDSARAADSVAAGSLDFVFIDGDHSYEGVTADLLAWVPKVKPGGMVCGHDYGNNWLPDLGLSVKRAVIEFFGCEPELGADMTWRMDGKP